MSTTWMPEVKPEAGAIVTSEDEARFAREVEAWIQSQAFAAPTVTWSYRGRGAMWVLDVGDLAERVGGLTDEGDWGVIRRTHAPRWAQCMRVDGGWIVEVNGIAGPDCFARRVHSARGGRMRRLVGDVVGRRRVKDAGRLMAVYLAAGRHRDADGGRRRDRVGVAARRRERRIRIARPRAG